MNDSGEKEQIAIDQSNIEKSNAIGDYEFGPKYSIAGRAERKISCAFESTTTYVTSSKATWNCCLQFDNKRRMDQRRQKRSYKEKFENPTEFGSVALIERKWHYCMSSCGSRYKNEGLIDHKDR